MLSTGGGIALILTFITDSGGGMWADSTYLHINIFTMLVAQLLLSVIGWNNNIAAKFWENTEKDKYFPKMCQLAIVTC